MDIIYGIIIVAFIAVTIYVLWPKKSNTPPPTGGGGSGGGNGGNGQQNQE